jgi:alpha-amylase
MKLLARVLLFVIMLTSVACQQKEATSPTPNSTSTRVAEPTQAIPTEPPSLPGTPTSPAVPTETVSTAEPPASFWWNDTVFYEIFVRSFKDSDGDGIGDLNGLIEMLDYLNDGDPDTDTDLGITGIWLMPINPSPSYHGYDVIDYYEINPEYGSKEDFKRLMEEAHQRGIKVIIDLVINHSGRDHPWFQASQAGDSQFRDWYVWRDEHPGFLGPWGQPVWHRAGDSYYYGIFWDGMPDLNLENPQVTEAIYDITRYWLEEMGVDGFRMDAIRHLIEKGPLQENTSATHAWLQDYHLFYKSVNPQAFTVGEAWTSTRQIIDYIGDEVDIAFEFDLAQAFLVAAKNPVVAALNVQAKKVMESYPEGQYGVFLTNHDQNRVMFELREEKIAKLAATMMLTFPGVPFIYYGEEIGMIGSKPDEDIRLPMQWSGENRAGFTSGSPWREPHSDYPTRNVSAQSADPDSLLNHYRALIQLRNRHAALRSGGAMLVKSGSPHLYALLRYNDEEAFLVLVNSNSNDVTVDQYGLTLETGPFEGPMQVETVLSVADSAAPVINSQGGFENYQPFEVIPGQSSLIIRLAP